MPSSHVYADLSAGFFRYRVTDGTHQHIHRVHVVSATIDNTTDPGSPTGIGNLINPEADVNATARNFMAMFAPLTPNSYTMTLLDFQPVSGGAPSGPPQGLQPYTLTGTGNADTIPEAEVSYTFRDGEGAPVRFVSFGTGSFWLPASKPALSANWAGTAPQEFAAYVTGVAKTSAPAYPANMSKVCSHHGALVATPLSIVSGLNNKLRRTYRVK